MCLLSEDHTLLSEPTMKTICMETKRDAGGEKWKEKKKHKEKTELWNQIMAKHNDNKYF